MVKCSDNIYAWLHFCSQVVFVGDVENYYQQVGHTPMLSFLDLFCLDSGEIADEFEACYESRVCPVDADSWEELLLPSHRQRREIYRRQTDERLAMGLASAHHSHVYDLDQNPLKRPRISSGVQGESSALFALTDHGTLCCDDFWRWLSSLEWVISAGIPLTHSMQQVCGMMSPIPWTRLLKERMVTHNAVRSMIGNGFNFCSVGPWAMWVLSNIELRHRHSSLQPSLASSDVESVDSDSGDEDGEPIAKVPRFQTLSFD